MTPTNPLDDKVIIRKSHFAEICAMLNPLNQEQYRVAKKAMRLLAQNNTGWAAVPVKLKESMYAAIQRTGDQQSECQKVKEYFKKCNYNYAWFLVREAQHTAMIAASPALEQCKIPEEVK